MKKKLFLTLLILAFVLVLVGIGGYLYVFRKAPADLSKARTDFRVEAPALFEAFEKDEKAASARYVGAVLEVRGALEGIEQSEWGQTILTFVDPFFGVTATIDSVMSVRQESWIGSLNRGDTVTVKGRCDGMLTDVRLVKCMLVGER